ncbi:MAG: hypothetical protein M1118_01395 [Chloroflexi bacterium]|nr:hypothetical protein [Chloroflexota bacterium]
MERTPIQHEVLPAAELLDQREEVRIQLATTAPIPCVAYRARDLFFGMRVRSALRRLGLTSEEVATDAALVHGRHMVLLLELDPAGDGWGQLAQRAAALGIPTLAFGTHEDQELWCRAKAAGVTRIVAKSALVRHFDTLVARLLHQQQARGIGQNSVPEIQIVMSEKGRCRSS